jgi:hypothetical protein
MLNSSADDIIDLYPDVFLGRFPCRNIMEVKAIVNKIITYETTPADDSWFKNIVAIGGDSFPEINGSYEGEEYTQQGLCYMQDFNHIKLYTSDGSLKNWKDIVKAINKGCGFVFFSGAASTSSWGTNHPNESTRFYCLRSRHIPFLLNYGKLPILVNGGSCHNNNFDVSILDNEWSRYPIFNCMGWALTKKTFGGVISAIGPTSVVHETPTINTKRGGIERLDIHFFEEYNTSETKLLGDICGHSIYRFLQNYSVNWDDTITNGDRLIVKNVQAWLLIGDPSLKIGGYQ